MNSTSRTLTFAAVALVAASAATLSWFGTRPAKVEGFADVGEPFSPKFDDPLTATSLTVTEFNDKTKEAQSFSVKQNDNGEWVIPSHHNYPAEARDRLARTAASMIGIRRTAVQSRSKEDWKNHKVVDPAAEGAATKDERGTRITLRDASGNALVDLIVGKKVEGREKHYFVREPDKNTTYVAQMEVDLSAKFADWIEPDLLKVSQSDIVRVVLDNYSVNEEEGAIVPGETLKFSMEKANAAATEKWMLDGVDEAKEKLDENAVRDLTRNLDQLKIVGVRPKPQGLNADLTMSKEVSENPLLRQVLQSDMQRQGFFAARTPEGAKLVSNEGELIAGTKNGVRYTLYFGEIARGSEKDIEVGFAGDGKAADAAGEEKAGETKDGEKKDAADEKPEPEFDKEAEGPRRYLLVKVDFDESLLGPAPTEPVAPTKPAILDAPAAEATPAEKVEQKAAPSEEAKPEAASPSATEAAAEPPASADPAKEAPPAAEEKSEATPDAVPDASGEGDKEENKDSEDSCGPEEEPKDADPASTTENESEATEASEETTAAATEAVPATPAAAESAPEQETATEKPAATDGQGTPAAVDATAAPVEGQPAAEGTPAETSPAGTPAETPSAPGVTEKPAEAATTPEAPKDPKVLAQEEYQRAMGEYEAKKTAYNSDVKARTEKITAGKKTVEELSARFGSWYYVISAESFEKFKIARKSVVGPKTEEKKDESSGSLPPGILPPGILPPK